MVPLAEKHALSIGIFGYRDHLHFGLYADPEAMPDVTSIPSALEASLRSLARYAAGVRRSTNSVQPSPARS